VLKAKVCLIGEAAVGKTSLIRRYVEDAFDDRYITTLGAKVSLKRLWISPKNDPAKQLEVQMSIWDLIGEKSYLETLHQSYLRGTMGLIAVCDITRYSTFEALDRWIATAFGIAGEVPLALVVNKVDLKDQVPELHYEPDEPQNKAQTYCGFAIWTSAKSGENVNSMFTKLALGMVRRIASAEAA
jgi:small GTP-binding protein